MFNQDLYKTECNFRFKVVFPKNRKAWVAKPIMEKKSFGFVEELVNELQECHVSQISLPQITVPASIPTNIASIEKPPKEDVIKAHMSRMTKKSKT